MTMEMGLVFPSAILINLTNPTRPHKGPERRSEMRTRFLLISLVCFALTIGGLMLIIINGCASVAIMQHQEAFNLSQRAFITYPSIGCDEELDIVLEKVTVHILCRDSMKKPTAGLANTDNEIWVIGRRGKNGIILNDMIGGHEWRHLLNWEDPRIANPDL